MWDMEIRTRECLMLEMKDSKLEQKGNVNRQEKVMEQGMGASRRSEMSHEESN